jgi:uncharacterized protein (TIGR02145 family)
LYTEYVGFNALPGGYGNRYGGYPDINVNAYFWTSSRIDNENMWGRQLKTENDSLLRVASDDGNRYSIRCVQD